MLTVCCLCSHQLCQTFLSTLFSIHVWLDMKDCSSQAATKNAVIYYLRFMLNISASEFIFRAVF